MFSILFLISTNADERLLIIERVVDFLAPELGDKIDEDILEIDLGKLSWTRLKALASLCFETLSQRKSNSK